MQTTGADMKLTVEKIISMYEEAVQLCEEKENVARFRLAAIEKRRKEIQTFLEKFEQLDTYEGEFEVGPDGPTLCGVRLP